MKANIEASNKLLSSRIAALEATVPKLDSRLTKLEEINRTCDFPISFTNLRDQELHLKYKECLKRLNDISNMENQLDKSPLIMHIMKLEEENQRI